jgi:heme/copper-type cytochrome/quinol oxidase subunit 2
MSIGIWYGLVFFIVLLLGVRILYSFNINSVIDDVLLSKFDWWSFLSILEGRDETIALQTESWYMYINGLNTFQEVLVKYPNLIMENVLKFGSVPHYGPMFLNKLDRPTLFPFQPSASRIMQAIIDLHHEVMSYIFFIAIIIFMLFLHVLINQRLQKINIRRSSSSTYTPIEGVWTIIPTLILMSIAIPSLGVLFAVDDVDNPEVYVQVIGKQWYWSYVVDKNKIYSIPSVSFEKMPYFTYGFDAYYSSGLDYLEKFESYWARLLLNEEEGDLFQEIENYNKYNSISQCTTSLKKVFKSIITKNDVLHVDSWFPGLRSKEILSSKAVYWPYLSVDNPLILPIHTRVLLEIFSEDVIHSWAVPSLGVKVDAVPGRINLALLYMTRPGFYYGQCSELCGVNHAFMPIVVYGIRKDEFVLSFGNDTDIEYNLNAVADTFTIMNNKKVSLNGNNLLFNNNKEIDKASSKVFLSSMGNNFSIEQTIVLLLTICSVCVIIVKDIMYAIISFLITSILISLTLLYVGIDFFAMLILLIYSGALTVLFLFVIMLFDFERAKKHYNSHW